MDIFLAANILQSEVPLPPNGGKVICWIKLYTTDPNRIYYYKIRIMSVLVKSDHSDERYQLQVNCQLYRPRHACDEITIDMHLQGMARRFESIVNSL